MSQKKVMLTDAQKKKRDAPREIHKAVWDDAAKQRAKERRAKGTIQKKSGKKKEFDPKKYAGDKINQGIDKGKNKLISEGSKAVGGIADRLKKGGVDKNLVDWGASKLLKGGRKLVNEGAGRAKKWIHTEGRQLVNEGIHKAKEGLSNLGKRARDKFSEFTGRLKRRKT